MCCQWQADEIDFWSSPCKEAEKEAQWQISAGQWAMRWCVPGWAVQQSLPAMSTQGNWQAWLKERMKERGKMKRCQANTSFSTSSSNVANTIGRFDRTLRGDGSGSSSNRWLVSNPISISRRSLLSPLVLRLCTSHIDMAITSAIICAPAASACHLHHHPIPK